ncbi:dolichol-phosphate mannosyltransferase [Rhizobium sp. SG_E_25_P2]|uniref:glycosyltransferase family 2 protein n=1 Tax=Rhizobium sp. SG_E_25_P2 TaxID=2879942 RepID=UPI0024753BB0|nr:glycosyltransferase family 2 protein [Rhizobium sp. SG_E_25_P2]MDH6269181.1 dolichol-phosphate mannosyltransferase [Rhizobium sp. SG_E_25_P2]
MSDFDLLPRLQTGADARVAPPLAREAGKDARPLPRAAIELTVVIPSYCERDNIAELFRRIDAALAGVAWEAVVVDDDSPDGTAALAKSIGGRDPRLRCIRRVGRRGLSGAVIEGMLSSSAPVVAVIDADLQHDETLLPNMLKEIRAGADIAIASRYAEGGSASDGFSGIRRWGSEMATRLARGLMGVSVTDPMSGFFMLRREIVEAHAPELSSQGYKLLADLLWSAGRDKRIVELTYRFRARQHGESKLDALVTLDYLGLIFSKLLGGALPVRFLMFAAVGASGVAVHLMMLQFGISHLGLAFGWAQALAVITAMTWNFVLNNRLTYRDARLTGWGFMTGLVKFYLACSIGSIGNVGVASWIYSFSATAWLAGLAGAVMGAVFNYAVSSALIWKK